jgi:hypothetical protein
LLHGLHNALQVLMHNLAKMAQNNPEAPLAVLLRGDDPLLYHPVTVILCGALVAALMWGLHGERYRRTEEEQLEEARQQRDAPLVGA